MELVWYARRVSALSRKTCFRSESATRSGFPHASRHDFLGAFADSVSNAHYAAIVRVGFVSGRLEHLVSIRPIDVLVREAP